MLHTAQSFAESTRMAKRPGDTLLHENAKDAVMSINDTGLSPELRRACGSLDVHERCLRSNAVGLKDVPTHLDYALQTDDTISLRDDTSATTARLHCLPPLDYLESFAGQDISSEGDDMDEEEEALAEELECRWILNLSMRFKDESNREKFFVTFAEKPNQWRRVTISLTYTDAPPGSLEADLFGVPFQREKNYRIYRAIRDCLSDINFCDTVTNLKLETSPEDGQLHIHVREDINEVIEYPQVSTFRHVECRRCSETELDFVAHLSGFVYKVQADGATVVKKEIAGPDAITEFMYEVNALSDLVGCGNVIQLVGLVTDTSGERVKGILISHADKGALVDILYDFAGTSQLPWSRREKWARQIIQGLCDIHEAGYVQGDFTLSNIVVDCEDNAAIIDINRRGCPIGWEPPELARLIDSGQTISMYISTKTDLFQLGMVLWALAEVIDEPERAERPLPPLSRDVPGFFRHIVDMCLAAQPQDRASAKDLLGHFWTGASSRRPDELALDTRKRGCNRGRSPTLKSCSRRPCAKALRTLSILPDSDSCGKSDVDIRVARFVHVDSGFDEPAFEE